jgi:hypothetical protein
MFIPANNEQPANPHIDLLNKVLKENPDFFHKSNKVRTPHEVLYKNLKGIY